ncbi:MAG: hypothetical protein M3Z20_10250 [Chloroflexota bacterium]|nr:hypothetical protein [Chloroflexota bacterium]
MTASTRLTVLLWVGLALATCDIAGLADGAGRLAGAGAAVHRLLAIVLDRAARIGAGLGQRLGLAGRRRLALAFAFAAARTMMGLAVLAAAVVAVPLALDAAAVLLVRLSLVIGVLPG